MYTRLKYQNCALHDQPLNYLCLHAKCCQDRLICVICRQERHSESHLTVPLKKYISSKVQHLKCLTQSKMSNIQLSLNQQKQKVKQTISQITKQVIGKLNILQDECDTFFNSKLNSVKHCFQIIKNQQFEARNIASLQQAVTTITEYMEYEQQMMEKLNRIKQTIERVSTGFNLSYNESQSKWQGHPKLQINQNIIKSNDNEYKIAILAKPICRGFNKVSFRVNKSMKNWIAVGVCIRPIVNSRQFDFRYYTIGHGVYALSSNGGAWSHHCSQINNKLGCLQFGEKDELSIQYDFNERKIWIENGKTQKFGLQVDEKDCKRLSFCAILYHEADELQYLPELNFLK